MKLILTFVSAGALVFMLRILAGLLEDRKSLSRPIRVYFAKFNPAKRRGELIVMNSKNYARKSAVETGKRAALIVVAAVLLTLPLHGQQAAKVDYFANGPRDCSRACGHEKAH
jgi:hypothetical protein